MQYNNQNYLIPVDALLEHQSDAEFECISLSYMLERLDQAKTLTNIVILDACRNNPFESEWTSQPRSGLAYTTAPSGTIISYATLPGNTASDGTGTNGLFTQELLKNIPIPGIPIEEVFKRTRFEVQRKSHHTQIPTESSSLIGEFYFVESNWTSTPEDRQGSQELVDSNNGRTSKWNTSPIFQSYLQYNAKIPPSFSEVSQEYDRGEFVLYKSKSGDYSLKQREAFLEEALDLFAECKRREMKANTFTYSKKIDETLESYFSEVVSLAVEKYEGQALKEAEQYLLFGLMAQTLLSKQLESESLGITFTNLGSVYYQQKDYPQAALSFKKALSYSPTIQLHLFLAKIYKEGEQPELYERELFIASKNYPDNLTILHELANHYINHFQHAQAISVLTRLLDKKNDDPEILLALGVQQYYEMEKLLDAMVDLENRAQSESISKEILLELNGIESQFTNKAEVAIKTLEKCVRRSPKSSKTWFYKGAIHQNCATGYQTIQILREKSGAENTEWYRNAMETQLEQSLTGYEYATEFEPLNKDYKSSYEKMKHYLQQLKAN